MMKKYPSRPNYYFWILSISSLMLITMGIVVSWGHSRVWVQTLWHICQAHLQNLAHLQLNVWQFVIPLILLIIISRGGVSFIQQIRATRRLIQTFYPLKVTPPTRLQTLLVAHNLTIDDVVFLNLTSSHAFCLGFFRPRIWLTSGLVNLLSEAELAAVIAHEAYHCQKRDPLRLAISRALQAGFFFLPVVGDLAKAVKLQQEVAADQAAIAYLKSDLPLLCALQKLIKQGAAGFQSEVSAQASKFIAYSPFNVTEARLKRLVYPPTPTDWRCYLKKWGLNLTIIVGLVTVVFLSTQPVATHHETITCSPDQLNNVLHYQSPWLDYNS